ncbi:MAG TPA: protein phosphatase 2C domain-containing protein [Leptolyngbyaceae cyanobacterium]
MSSSEPPINRYLWVADPIVVPFPAGELIQGRYQVVAPQIWLDTQPELPSYVPQELPDQILPYLHLFPFRLHIPEVYGLAVLDNESDTETPEVILLENVPIDKDGNLYPSMLEAWSQAKPVRWVYWLWQILQLWTPLLEMGVASSLLIAENLRVQGWRVWLLELYQDASELQKEPSLQELGECWLDWISASGEHPAIARLQEICQQMVRGVELQAIATQLNQLLLEQAARLPLRLQVAGETDTGPKRQSNEDTCYPTAADMYDRYEEPNDLLIPHLSLVCDGIGGHEGGEVASSLALQTLKLQLRALLVEVAEQNDIVPPELIVEQLTAIIRVVNNMISTQNDAQGREMRQRMGTTLVMGLQLPQKIKTPDGEVLGNAHELYIASVGDSRVYWITEEYCLNLTVDDDVASREVRMGRSLYREALRRVDGGALTQALGTRDAELLRPSVQRLIIEEDGLLLLCSDGLSDRGVVESTWQDFAKPVLKGRLPLESAVRSWVEVANQRNGHDNTSIVLTCCLLSPEPPMLFDPKKAEMEEETRPFDTNPVELEMTAASRALLYDRPPEYEEESVEENERSSSRLPLILGMLTALALVSLAGYGVWRSRTPENTSPPPTSIESPN